jgi:hypothetical protein
MHVHNIRGELFFLAAAAIALFTRLATAAPEAGEVLRRALDHDPWGMAGARVKARVQLTDKVGKRDEIAFSAQSLRHDGPLAKSLVRFTAPAELRGAGFLQIQRRDADDDRFLFLPELGKARRISGNLRGGAFMGTDFSFADLDRRDLRDGRASFGNEETVAGSACFGLTVVPRDDSQYSRIELWVAKDSYLPVRMRMYDRAGVLLKRFEAEKTARIGGQWFITRSSMVNERHGHSTVLLLDDVAVVTDLPDSTFTVKTLERM